MHNLKMTLAYDGTSFLGWQKTNMGPSIEGALEEALTTFLRHSVQLQAASRTDRGVHAEGQVVNVLLPEKPDLFRLQKGLRGLLPKDIALTALEFAPFSFHPTLDSIAKEYRYGLCLGLTQLPFHQKTSWHIKQNVTLALMEKAADFLIGEHDFSAFTSEKKENNVRQIHAISFEPLPNERLQIVIKGNRFLYKMVRTLVGTLVYVGMGKISPQDIGNILSSKDRTRAGPTAPAHALSLTRVFYP